MDIDYKAAPPINNALLPDIYNKLDAEAIEKTRVANTQLGMRLSLEQKIITKYRYEAERFIKMEKSKVAQDLSKINQKLPAVSCLKDFDEKFFKRRSISDPNTRRKEKNYMSSKSDEKICHRCYIHHLPLKKKFYRIEAPPLPPLAHVASSDLPDAKNHQVPNSVERDENGDDSALSPALRIAEDLIIPDGGDPPAEMTGARNRCIAPIEKYKFLQRESWGREKDLNHTLTPRLMANEQWKVVVQNVCSQCEKGNQRRILPGGRGSKAANGYLQYGIPGARPSRERTRDRDSIKSRGRGTVKASYDGSSKGSASRSNTRGNSFVKEVKRRRSISESRGQSPSLMKNANGRGNSKKDNCDKPVSRQNSTGSLRGKNLSRTNSMADETEDQKSLSRKGSLTAVDDGYYSEKNTTSDLSDSNSTVRSRGQSPSKVYRLEKTKSNLTTHKE